MYNVSTAYQAYLNIIIVLLSLTFIADVIRCEGGEMGGQLTSAANLRREAVGTIT